MPRKSKEEVFFEAHKQTIYEAAKGRDKDYLEDRLFAVLLVCGYPAAQAYRLAYPQSNASLQSSAALACRRVKEPYIQEILSRISNSYWDGFIMLNDRVCVEKSRRRPAYRGKRKNKIDPV